MASPTMCSVWLSLLASTVTTQTLQFISSLTACPTCRPCLLHNREELNVSGTIELPADFQVQKDDGTIVPLVVFEFKSSSPGEEEEGYTEFCTIDLADCPRENDCFCRELPGRVWEFYIMRKAKKWWSFGTLRGSMNDNQSNTLTSDTITLPYISEEPVSTLTVNSNTEDLQNCHLHYYDGDIVYLVFCTYNLLGRSVRVMFDASERGDATQYRQCAVQTSRVFRRDWPKTMTMTYEDRLCNVTGSFKCSYKIQEADAQKYTTRLIFALIVSFLFAVFLIVVAVKVSRKREREIGELTSVYAARRSAGPTMGGGPSEGRKKKKKRKKKRKRKPKSGQRTRPRKKDDIRSERKKRKRKNKKTQRGQKRRRAPADAESQAKKQEKGKKPMETSEQMPDNDNLDTSTTPSIPIIEIHDSVSVDITIAASDIPSSVNE